MVQYIITPWRNRRELLVVRGAFYPPPGIIKAANDMERHEAVERVSVWVQRGNCPHSVESTALLVSAMLNEAAGTSAYAMRAAYSAAFSRFVTGLLDGYQDKKHKLSMYSIAKNIGLPATFVELRHQCTHEELPSLAKLRTAAERSLVWIWDHYWKNLDQSTAPVDVDERRAYLLEYLQRRANNHSQEQGHDQDFQKRLRKWNNEQLLEGLMDLTDSSTTEPHVLRQALRFSRAILSDGEYPSTSPETHTRSLEEVRADVTKAEAVLQREAEEEYSPLSENGEQVKDTEKDEEDEGAGWMMWKGPWSPKPIGLI